MAFTIEILKVAVERRGKFSTAIVDHKTLDGKVDSKKVQSFTFKDVFDTLSKASQGDVFEIESKKIKNEKDGKEYWTWVSATSVGDKGVATSGANVAKVVRSSYETPDERAARQVYIVRQSSIANAIAYFETVASVPTEVKDIIDVAKKFEAYVFSNNQLVSGKDVVLPSEVE